MATTTRTTIKWENRFGKVTRDTERAIWRALEQAGKAGAAVSSSVASTRKDTGKMADIKVTGVRRGKKGLNILFVSTPFYAIFQEHGTLGSRKKKLKKATLQRRSSGSGQARLAKVAGSPGIEPLKFMGKGRTAARKLLLPLIQREIGRVR